MASIRVSRLTATHRTTATIDVGYEPVGLAISPSVKRRYLVNSSSVSVVSAARRDVVASIPHRLGDLGIYPPSAPRTVRVFRAHNRDDWGGARTSRPIVVTGA